jgi:hypothetical protein
MTLDYSNTFTCFLLLEVYYISNTFTLYMEVFSTKHLSALILHPRTPLTTLMISQPPEPPPKIEDLGFLGYFILTCLLSLIALPVLCILAGLLWVFVKICLSIGTMLG